MTEMVIGCAYRVHNVLGYGFLEKVYENALAHELRKAGLHVEQQKRIEVNYDGIPVGEYIADMVVEATVLVELKAARALDEAHAAQCLKLSHSHTPPGLPPPELRHEGADQASETMTTNLRRFPSCLSSVFIRGHSALEPFNGRNP